MFYLLKHKEGKDIGTNLGPTIIYMVSEQTLLNLEKFSSLNL